MDGLGQRERGFEAKYLHGEELDFRVRVKRNHLFGIWITTLLGYTDQSTHAYIEEVITVDIQKKHEDDVLYKVLRDLELAGLGISEHRLRKQLTRCWIEARKMIMNKEEK